MGQITAELTTPIYEYPHSATRCSITGGVVSRDRRLADLSGLYLWSDLWDGQLYAINPQTLTTVTPLRLTVPQPTTFGNDARERAYAAGGFT